MVKSRFNDDIQISSMTEHFTKCVIEKSLGLDTQLVHYKDNPNDQYLGKDLLVKDGPKQLSLEVKFAATYAGPGKNKNGLETFAQEISYLKDGVERRGWAIDSHKQTDCYCFGWVPRVLESIQLNEKGYTHLETMRDARFVQLAFIERNSLRKNIKTIIERTYPEVSNITVEEFEMWLYAIATNVRSGSITAERFNKSISDDLFLFYNRSLYERPINLLVKKKNLKAWSDCWLEIEIKQDNQCEGYLWRLKQFSPDKPLPFKMARSPLPKLFESKREWSFVNVPE